MSEREKSAVQAAGSPRGADARANAVRARILGLAGEALVKRKEFEAALERFREKLAIHQAAEDFDGAAATHMQIGHVYRLMDSSPRAAEQYRIALALGRHHDLKPRISESFLNLAMMFYFQKETEQSQEYFQNAISEIRSAGPCPLLGRALMHFGNLYRKEGTNKKAEQCFSEAIKVFKSLGDEYNLGLALANRALLCLAQNEEDQGKAMMREAFDRLFFAGALSEIHLFKATLESVYRVKHLA